MYPFAAIETLERKAKKWNFSQEYLLFFLRQFL